jgi:aminoglycoside phosphotransferase (APT) family kinase protein
MHIRDLRSALQRYYLKVLGYHSPQALILRIYLEADAFDKSGREYPNLNLLNRIGYPVPEAYILEQGSSYLGNPFIIIERIPGHMLWQILLSSQFMIVFSN